ncbi:hypothetical protein LA6_000549 [Marinibacterium anthonyi]|nr:hypothetical protein LA6_000549 [Marinibacterium anthonyi]|tara:strand:- start:355 stop:474 length:120 start_codon:yes stop_codon:yes gene_type:complete
MDVVFGDKADAMLKAHSDLPHPIEELEEVIRVSNTERLY